MKLFGWLRASRAQNAPVVDRLDMATVTAPIGRAVYVPADSMVELAPGGGILIHSNGNTIRCQWVDGIPNMGDYRPIPALSPDDPNFGNPMANLTPTQSLSENIDSLLRAMSPPEPAGNPAIDDLAGWGIPKAYPEVHTKTCNHDPTHNWTGAGPCPYCQTRIEDRMAAAGWNDLPLGQKVEIGALPGVSVDMDYIEKELEKRRHAAQSLVGLPNVRVDCLDCGTYVTVCDYENTQCWKCGKLMTALSPPVRLPTLADLAAQDRANLNRLAKSAGLDPVIVEPRKNDDDLNAIVERRESSHVDSGERRRASDMGDGDDPGCLRPGFMFASDDIPAKSASADSFTRLREAVDAHRASAILHDRVNRLSDALDKQTEAAVTKDHIAARDGWAEPYDEPFDDRLQFAHEIVPLPARPPEGPSASEIYDQMPLPEKVYGTGPVDIAMPGRQPQDKLFVIPDQHWGDVPTHNRGLPGFPGLTREDVANGDGPSAERPFTDFYPGDRGMRTDDRDRKPGAKPRVKLRWSDYLGRYIAVSGWS